MQKKLEFTRANNPYDTYTILEKLKNTEAESIVITLIGINLMLYELLFFILQLILYRFLPNTDKSLYS